MGFLNTTNFDPARVTISQLLIIRFDQTTDGLDTFRQPLTLYKESGIQSEIVLIAQPSVSFLHLLCAPRFIILL